MTDRADASLSKIAHTRKRGIAVAGKTGVIAEEDFAQPEVTFENRLQVSAAVYPGQHRLEGDTA
jgi:hypothetical protein